jgi:signal transduction histidine kinase
MGLRAKLVSLLLAFGLVPLIAVIAIGYAVSRATILRQAADGLDALAQAQAVHLATELRRERLLLRTIAGQLPPYSTLRRTPATSTARLLVLALPEGGVFDGLRIVTSDGTVLASVALRNTAPHWPDRAPAADWTAQRVAVHREGSTVVAYLLATPLVDAPGTWLEGHVRRADFDRVFALPAHLQEGVESAVVERDGRLVFALHRHSAPDFARYLAAGGSGGGRPGDALISMDPVGTSDWMFVAELSREVALAPLARLRNTAFAGAAVFVLLIVATGLFAARSVTTPLRGLASAARDLGTEGRHSPLPVRSRDEIGSLVEAFNGMAATLLRSREEIEHLHARELERAQQLATVGELASGVAHEIRNPLTGVRGALELALRRLPAAEPSRPLLEEAQLQLNRIETATTQLLRYARPPELRQVVVDGNLLVERAARVVGAQAAHYGIAVRSEPSADPVTVRVDSELMVQVLVNLMLNGIEAMAEGGTLTVRVTRQATDVAIAVRDTGPGIPPDQRSAIFRPFYTTKHQGTGLGLSISRQIVARHGGTLRVQETAGGGTTLVVTLPLSADGAAKA